MKKLLLPLALLVLLTAPATAQLAAGDIAIVCYNADNTDAFGFVALVDIPGMEEIKFTDNGWQAGNTFRTGEGIITWTAPAGGVAKSTVVIIDTTPSATVGTVGEVNDLNFSGSGDQILAYQGMDASPTFLAALNSEGAGVWQADATNTNTSALPMGLTNGTDANALNEIDNAAYTGSTMLPDEATARSTINNNLNWTGDNTNNQSCPMFTMVPVELMGFAID